VRTIIQSVLRRRRCHGLPDCQLRRHLTRPSGAGSLSYTSPKTHTADHATHLPATNNMPTRCLRPPAGWCTRLLPPSRWVGQGEVNGPWPDPSLDLLVQGPPSHPSPPFFGEHYPVRMAAASGPFESAITQPIMFEVTTVPALGYPRAMEDCAKASTLLLQRRFSAMPSSVRGELDLMKWNEENRR
jgi:hypothetical protein